MKKFTFFISIAFLTVLFSSCEAPWQPLFNSENLDGWETYIGTPLTGFEDNHAQATPEKVFQVVDVDGEKLIHISGEVNGSLATVDTFANYHLELVFKWGEQVYTSRNTCCETEATQTDKGFQFSKGGELTQFGKDFNGPGIKKAVDAEKPLGEWNTVELYSVGRTTVHVVNGQVTMVNTNTGINEDGQIKPLSSGKIQIQSEGGDLFIKSVRIKPIKEIPAEILQ
jgi:hypothetical protein